MRYCCLNKMKDEALVNFKKDYVRDDSLDADIILVRSTNMLDIELSKNVKIIGRAGIGVNTIPYKKYAKEGIVVVNTPGGNANAVKELTILSMVLSGRDIFGASEWVKSMKDDPDIVEKIEKEKTKYTGEEVLGKTLGVIGLGAIGGQVANTAIDLGMDVIGYDPYISIEHAWGLSKYIKRVESMEELVSSCDILTIHTPLNDETKGMIDMKILNLLKDGSVVINLARAAIINEKDMLECLKSGKVSKFITDFANPNVVNFPSTIIFPHIGGATGESEIKCSKMAVRETMDYIENGNIINSVNYPDVNAGICMTKERICINHLNKAGMISNFSNVFSKNGVNIAKMFNNSLDDVAYTIFDLDSDIDSESLKELEALDGVIRVRVLNGKKH